MNGNQMFVILVQIAVLSVFVTSLIEVIKGISAVGAVGLVKELWYTLINNKKMGAATFPVLNFVVALLFCWAFDISIMKQIFATLLGNRIHEPIASWLDYFGTASVVYAGADMFFKKLLAAEKSATSTIVEIKKDQQSISADQQGINIQTDSMKTTSNKEAN